VAFVNKRIYYAIKAVGIAECGTNTYTTAHGAQSAGLNLNFNLLELLELGQIENYALVEDLPEVELTIEKTLDGYPLLYHLASKTATAKTLAHRSGKKASVALSFYQDDQDAASGTPTAQAICSGQYLTSLSYQFPVDGFGTETAGFVGNNLNWNTGQSTFLFQPSFNNTDAPLAAGGPMQRQHMQMGLAASLFPSMIPGITSSGTNELQSDGSFSAHLGRIQVSTNLGREALREQGLRTPYYRFQQFPTRVTTQIDVITSKGHLVNAVETSTSNIVDQTIRIWTQEGIKLDLGTKNKLQSVTQGGANAQQNGGNESVTYSFFNLNKMDVTHPQDPAGL
jgi:hypothetical protein